MLLHMVDLADPMVEPEEAIRVIEGELKAFSPVLFEKPRWLVGNKVDALQDEDRKARFAALCRARGQEPIFISGVTGEGIRPLVFRLDEALNAIPKA
jgi:GTP-binding protein